MDRRAGTRRNGNEQHAKKKRKRKKKRERESENGGLLRYNERGQGELAVASVIRTWTCTWTRTRTTEPGL